MTRSDPARRKARRAVEAWLAQWGIHNDGEIYGLLDALEDASLAIPPTCTHADERREYSLVRAFRATCRECGTSRLVPAVPSEYRSTP